MVGDFPPILFLKLCRQRCVLPVLILSKLGGYFLLNLGQPSEDCGLFHILAVLEKPLYLLEHFLSVLVRLLSSVLCLLISVLRHLSRRQHLRHRRFQSQFKRLSAGPEIVLQHDIHGVKPFLSFFPAGKRLQIVSLSAYETR